jgi:hypothetical protein
LSVRTEIGGRLRSRSKRGIAVALGLWSSVASAHTLLSSPSPRDAADSHKDPSGPCGVARLPSQPENAPFVAGSQLSVTWTETVDHPGCFVLDFSPAGDTGWATLATVPHSESGDTPRAYSTTLTLPSAPCPACTVRLRQIMLDHEPAAGEACPPANLASGLTYYSCANVVLEAGTSAASGGSTSSGPLAAAPVDGSCAYAGGKARGAALWAMLCGLALTLVRRIR